jgi:hypothetical protein
MVGSSRVETLFHARSSRIDHQHQPAKDGGNVVSMSVLVLVSCLPQEE